VGSRWGVVAFDVAIPGDYNGDRSVDLADLVVWNKDYNSSQNVSTDGNEDGVVDAADYVVWRQHVESNQSASAASATAVNSLVPEPSAVLQLLLILGASNVSLSPTHAIDIKTMTFQRKDLSDHLLFLIYFVTFHWHAEQLS
jgi:hypothetical protein